MAEFRRALAGAKRLDWQKLWQTKYPQDGQPDEAGKKMSYAFQGLVFFPGPC